MVLNLFPDKTASFTQISKPGIKMAEYIPGCLVISGQKYRMQPDGIRPKLPFDGYFCMYYETDTGENYVIKLAKIRTGKIVPAVTDADILEIYAMLKNLQISEARQNEAIQDLNARTDTDLLGSIL